MRKFHCVQILLYANFVMCKFYRENLNYCVYYYVFYYVLYYALYYLLYCVRILSCGFLL